ncbi:MAG: hypothetical protein ACR2OI_06855, partial [Acidimicrobiia bacterium]
MAEEHARDELLDLLPASSVTVDPLSPVAEFLTQLKALGITPLDADVSARHLTMLKDEAANNPAGVPVAQGSAGPLVRRRHRAVGSFVSGFAMRVLIGTLAFTAIGTGTAFAADGAVPGDLLYGLDRALESVGINDGGALERIEEARTLVINGHHEQAVAAVEKAVANIAADADAGAAGALEQAAGQIASVTESEGSGYQDTQVFRDQVSGLLATIEEEVESDMVDGSRIAETARQFSETAREFAAGRGQGLGPDGNGPPGQSGEVPG